MWEREREREASERALLLLPAAGLVLSLALSAFALRGLAHYGSVINLRCKLLFSSLNF